MAQPPQVLIAVRLNKTQRLTLFLASTFLVSWGLLLAFHLRGADLQSAEGRAARILYFLVPGFMAIVVRGAMARLPVADALGLKPKVNPWVFLAWVLPAVVLLVAFGLYAAVPAPGYHVITTSSGYVSQLRSTLPPEALEKFDAAVRSNPPPHPSMLVVEGLLGGVVNIVFGLGVELGWRGFLLIEIEAGFWRRSFVTGLVWGVWLVPLVLSGYLYPQHPYEGAVMVFAYTLLWSPALVLLRARSRTIWAPALTQGTILALAGPAEQLTVGGSDLTKPFAGVIGLLATALVVTLLIVLARRPVRSGPSPASSG